jgi:hypothetical protein
MKTPWLHRLMLVFPLVAWSAFAEAQANPSPVDRSKDNPALARFGRAVILYASFDGHENAEITLDDPRPAGNAAWQAAVKSRQDLFAPGVFGQGLRSGKHQLVFTSPKAGLRSSGSVVLWLKPERLAHRGTYCWPVILDALEGRYRVMFGRMGDPLNKEALYAYLSSGPAGVSVVQQSMADWKPGGWHLFVVTWDRSGVEFSVDAAPPSRASLKTPLPPGAGGLRAYLPGENEDVFVYDEFLVLDVPLSHAEIRRLFDEGMKMLSGAVRKAPLSFRERDRG